MEQTLIGDLRRGWVRELYQEVNQIGAQLETFGEIYLKHLGKHDGMSKKAGFVIDALIIRRKDIENEIKRFSAGDQADSGCIRWHKN